MNSRLQQFLNAENLSQAQFADSINVARASISHILAGRNKPGFEFIENLAKHYPALNIEWFITGKGRMYKGSQEPAKVDVPPESEDGDLFGFSERQIESNTLDIPKQTIKKERIINKILVFFNDGTFEEYTNGKE
jgi:transcriptional regulator with XRE-family HTH domain